MELDKIKQELAEIAIKYIYAVHYLEKDIEKDKSQANLDKLDVYTYMMEMLQKVSVKPCRFVFIQYGKKIREVQTRSDIDLEKVIKDLQRVDVLLGKNNKSRKWFKRG